MKKKPKDRRTTIMGAIAAALFLISHDESPVRQLIPDSAKPYTILATTAALGILGGVSADSKSKEKREEEEEGKV